MAGKISNTQRDLILTAFRERICEKMGVAPLIHQRKWWCAADGLILIEDFEDPQGVSVMLPDGSFVKWAVSQREGGRAKVIADLGAFKSGKSWSSGMWASGFAAIPGAKVSLVGLEYDIVEPEFNYIIENLLSDHGMGMKYDSLQNRPRDGKMFLDLPNGVRYEAKSWERQASLKGKEVDCYLFCEAYQLPGIECFTTVKQNLVARQGYAIFPTTPDRPWVKELHKYGHGLEQEWECICSIPRSQNFYTFDAKSYELDKKLMTKEKFLIAHEGKLGDFVGKVFNYEQGARQFTSKTHPELFGNDNQLRIPEGWEIVGAADTGTFYSGLFVAFSPEGDAFVCDEIPNYRYVGGLPERDESISIPQWAGDLVHRAKHLGGRPHLYADKNSQFKGELLNYGVTLLPAKAGVEARTEVTREYFQHNRIHLAPWLEILPFELENAQWPEETSAAGKFARVKDRDHTLDCLEHILALRPIGRGVREVKEKTWFESAFGRPPNKYRRRGPMDTSQIWRSA